MANLKRSITTPTLVLVYVILAILALSCIVPILHIIALSFSGKSAATGGRVGLIPVDFTINAYKLLINNSKFITSFGVSIYRIIIGVPINMLLIILVAYPLSIDTKKFKSRTIYVWFFAFTMFFSGGLVPSYMLVSQLNMLDTIWALVLPGAVQIFSAILLLNFFRGLPKEISESAFIDGANHFQVLTKIFLPISKPAISTVLLFTLVGHWNSWFDGIIYMNDTSNYPLQSYLQVMLSGIDFLFNSTTVSASDMMMIDSITNKTINAAQIFIGILPIVIIYPILQKYLVKGLVVGSVKG